MSLSQNWPATHIMPCPLIKIYVENPGTVVMNAIKLSVNFPHLKLYFWRFYLLENNFSWKNIKHIKYYIQADFLAFNHESKRLPEVPGEFTIIKFVADKMVLFLIFSGELVWSFDIGWEHRNERPGTVRGSESSALVIGKGTKHRLVYEAQQSFPRMSDSIKMSLFKIF